MDIDFFQGFETAVDKAPAEMQGYIQIHNISGEIIPVVEGWYLRTFKCAFVHPDNPKVQRLIERRRVRVVPFSIDKSKKPKKTELILEEKTEPVKETTGLELLENMFANPLDKETSE